MGVHCPFFREINIYYRDIPPAHLYPENPLLSAHLSAQFQKSPFLPAFCRGAFCRIFGRVGSHRGAFCSHACQPRFRPISAPQALQQGFFPIGHKKGRMQTIQPSNVNFRQAIPPSHPLKIKPNVNPCKRFELHRSPHPPPYKHLKIKSFHHFSSPLFLYASFCARQLSRLFLVRILPDYEKNSFDQGV